ncbi:hypothetical protein ABT236_22785 [Streptomyces sp. NPDC001523]|uniref:hypothetical protein n=1 Tax=Streptomyces sp. NPDC001523 TaxID=3154383 RepID=UPI003325A62E
MESHVTRGTKTPYADRIFDSKTEARWAVFFDVLGVSWRPQPRVQLKDCKGGWAPNGQRNVFVADSYRPDFYLPDLGTWVEVKATDAQLFERKEDHHRRSYPYRTAWDTGRPMLLLGDMMSPSMRVPAPGTDWMWMEISPHRWTSGDGTGPVKPFTLRPEREKENGVQARRVTFHRYPDEGQLTGHDAPAISSSWTEWIEQDVGSDNAWVIEAYRIALDSFQGSLDPAPGVKPGRCQV